MNSLLIGGAQNTGKSQAIYRIANTLVTKGFVIIAGSIPPTFNDFNVVLKGKDKNGKNIKIVINSATDTTDIIKNFKIFYDKHGVYDILISSIRDDDFYPRKDFFNIMAINEHDDSVLEIPFAKITRIKIYRAKPLIWFADKMNSLINHILNNNPFNVG